MNAVKASSIVLGMAGLGAALLAPVTASAATQVHPNDQAGSQTVLADSWNSVPVNVKDVAKSVIFLYWDGTPSSDTITKLTKSDNSYTFDIGGGFHELDALSRTPDGKVYHPGKSASVIEFTVQGDTNQVTHLTAFDSANNVAWSASAIPVQYKHIHLKGSSASWDGTFDVDVAQAEKPGTTYVDQFTQSGYSLTYHPANGQPQVSVKYNVFLPRVGGVGGVPGTPGSKGVSATTDKNGVISNEIGGGTVGWYTDDPDNLTPKYNILVAENPTAKVSVQWNGKTESFNMTE